MPELPEVETVVRTLGPLVIGRVLGRAEVLCPKILRQTPAAGLAELAGRRVRSVRRRGKMILIDCGDLGLVFHLKMTGQILVVPAEAPRDKHTHLVIGLHDGVPRRRVAGADAAAADELRFHDVRKFGFCRICPSGELASAPEIAALGPEPLEIGLEEFRARLSRRRGRIKSLLLDQAVIAGIGNIYTDEILFGAGIHPLTPVERIRRPRIEALFMEMRAVLERAIDAKGTSISDYVDAQGSPGGFQNLLRVYGREGEPCIRCGTAIRRIVIGGRSSSFCPKCQRQR